MPPDNYNYPKDSIRYTGIPINTGLKPVSSTSQADFKKELGLKPDDLVLVVIGGGQGSKTVNDLVLASSQQLVNSFSRLQILHIAGKDHSAELEDSYKNQLGEASSQVKVLGFTSELYKYTGAADLVITRAGATSIAELAVQGKACIIIPSPFLAGGHQMKNSKVLEKNSAAKILNNDISPTEFTEETKKLLKNGPARQELAKNIASLARPDAAEDLAEVMLAEMGR